MNEPRRSRLWSVVFRIAYRGIRVLAPLIASWIALGLPGLDGVAELRVVGRRSGRERSILVTLLTVDGRWYVGHPNGEAAWVRNATAAGEVRIDPPGPRGDRFRVVPVPPGPERDAVIRATWTQQPFPANLLYRAARRHVAAVGVYHRLDPIPDGPAPADRAATPHEGAR